MPPPALDALVGLLFGLLGGFLLPGRRQRPVGILLLATGAAWLLGSAFPGAVFLHRGPLVHLLVSYPRGRPKGLLEWLVVALGYLGTVEPVGRNQWVTAGLALVVTGVLVNGQRTASGAERRARLTSSAIGVLLMAILGFGAVARLAGADVDPGLVVVYEVALLASGAAVFADLRWGRWNRAAITSLVIDLGRSEHGGGVRDTLARALSDPDLILGFLDPESGALIDESGRPFPPAPAGGRTRTTLRRDGKDFAVVLHAPGALEDPMLLDSVTALTGLAFANARLQADVLARVGEVEASRRRILEVSDRERAALQEDLRAGADHRLDRVGLLLDPAEAELGDLLRESRASLRDFAQGVHPGSLAEGGLAAAYAELARTVPLPVSLDVPDIRFGAGVELSLYFVCAEALTNAVKYAGATLVQVRLVESADRVRLTVSDDGNGGAVLADPGAASGTGLRGLADRLAVIGGTLTVDSPPGHGTTVTAQVPRRLG